MPLKQYFHIRLFRSESHKDKKGDFRIATTVRWQSLGGMELADALHLHVETDRVDSGRLTPRKERLSHAAESSASPRDRDERFEVYKYVF